MENKDGRKENKTDIWVKSRLRAENYLPTIIRLLSSQVGSINKWPMKQLVVVQ